MRTKTKSRKMNEKRVKQVNTQKIRKDVRKHTQQCDFEKAAIIYLHLFMETKDVNEIDYLTFSNTWIKWFPADAYGCGNIFKKTFSKTVQCAGNTEESIRLYRDSVKIFNMDIITHDDMKELKELALKKGCSIKRAKDSDKNISGFCIKKIAPSNYQCRRSNILLGEKYECSFESAKKYLLNLPDIEDLKLAQEQLRSVLIANSTIQEKVDAIHKYPYYVSTYDFDIYLDRFVRNCDSWGALNVALQLCNKLRVLNTMNEKPLDIRANRNASKSLEQLGLFSNDRITRKMIATCIRNTGISTDYMEWAKEDFDRFTEELSKSYSAKYQYIRDRFPKVRDYTLWILSKYASKSYKELEKIMKDFLRERK